MWHCVSNSSFFHSLQMGQINQSLGPWQDLCKIQTKSCFHKNQIFHYLHMGKISQCVRPWQAFLVNCNVSLLHICAIHKLQKVKCCECGPKYCINNGSFIVTYKWANKLVFVPGETYVEYKSGAVFTKINFFVANKYAK